MQWHELYPKDKQPSEREISEYIGSPLWEELNKHLLDAYKSAVRVDYSTCGGAPGWNVKHRKGGKALCTLYPREGYFICFVSVGAKQQTEAELLLPSFSEYTRQLYARCEPFCGARWLMLDVRNEDTLSDAERLIDLRVRFK